MIALALDAPRSPDPVEHYVIQLEEGDTAHPPNEQVEEAVDLAMRANSRRCRTPDDVSPCMRTRTTGISTSCSTG